MRRIFCIVPHPDDEIGMAGFLISAKAAGFVTEVVCVTCGGRVRNRKYHLALGTSVGAVRERELRQSCMALSVEHIHFLGMTDGASKQWRDDGVTAKLSTLLRQIDPDIVVTSDDRGINGYPDHVQTNAVTLEAYDRLDPKATRALLFLTGYPRSYARRRLWWVLLRKHTKHQLIQKFTRDDTSVSFVLRLTRKELRAKMSLIKCHRSQFPDEKGRYLGVSLPLLRAFLRDECYVIQGKHQPEDNYTVTKHLDITRICG